MAEDSYVRKLDPPYGIFGLPPSNFVSTHMIRNSMPVMEIRPSKPSFKTGLTLFTVQDDVPTYNKILRNLGFEIEHPLRLAFLADNFPTDTFTNDYGETFLQKFTDVASQGMAQLAQMTGAQTGTQAIKQYGNILAGFGDMEGIAGKAFGAAGKGITAFGSGIEEIQKKLANQGGAAGGAGAVAGNVLNKMIAGNRVDFPQVWRNSGFSPSYTATVRLYNPNPGSYESTLRHIVGPLAAILTLAIPRSQDGYTYNWPFFHRVKVPGLWELNPGVITNITVVKGGDQQAIAWNHRLAMVDIRIDFVSLYTSMLIEEGVANITHRPTVRSYLANLLEEKYLEPVYSTADKIGGGSESKPKLINTKRTFGDSLPPPKLVPKPRTSSPTIVDSEGVRVSSSQTSTGADLKTKNTAIGL